MTDSEATPPRTTHLWVREQLRDRILSGIYAPGHPLKQTELAAQLSVSVTPVREAMRDLATEGLVVIDPQRVARVRDLDAREARELNEIRLLLEPLAAKLAATHATPDDTAAITALAQETVDAESETEWLDSNRRFHMAVIEGAHAPLLTGILSNLRQISSIYLAAAVRSSTSVREKSKREHLALAEAIAMGDGDEAARIIEGHLFPHAVLATVVEEHLTSDQPRLHPPAR
ncbi:GntR family transcriptional regulator [Salinibacterium hongtaonis]|uniref:GntR family transcriptional regulator n=1 Tax=Homoserinimonas hongtaonis TaxID=2079791 RepID=UPI000D3841EF|nr:GntR family transcriptional regulator [Salinibacterium hongtaonis]AWB90353.1 GntR family transcriptional regulator [Salinibacterium hongtaonis]